MWLLISDCRFPPFLFCGVLTFAVLFQFLDSFKFKWTVWWLWLLWHKSGFTGFEGLLGEMWHKNLKQNIFEKLLACLLPRPFLLTWLLRSLFCHENTFIRYDKSWLYCFRRSRYGLWPTNRYVLVKPIYKYFISQYLRLFGVFMSWQYWHSQQMHGYRHVSQVEHS